MSESTHNSDLQDLHDSLVQKVIAISKLIGQAADSDTVDVLSTELDEVNHRVTMVGNILFTAQTAAMTAAIAKLAPVNAQLTADLKALGSLKDFIRSVTAFLTLVDKVIDTAKLVGL